ncbi:MAG: SpoVA/SpoVAEb family sporulation membrane protein, partial [Ruminiclostridium sp.]
YSLAKGVFNEVDKIGILGAFTGGFKAVAAGLSAAIFFGYIMAAISKPKAKK